MTVPTAMANYPLRGLANSSLFIDLPQFWS